MSIEPFPTDLLPEPVAEYVRQAGAALGCDPAYIAVPMLAVIASAIGNTRRIRLKPTWSEPAVVWAAVVGESGTVKSPALELALRPVWRRQKSALKEHAKARAEYKAAMTEWKAVKKSDRGVEPEPPQACERPLCLDITIEALADRLLATPRGTLVAPDELAGWFGSFNQYKAGGADVAHWLSLFGARPLKVDRKTGDKTTIYVPNAAVSVTGTIQPDTLRRVLTPEFFDNGLTARILLAMPATTPKRWSESEIDGATDQAVTALFTALFELRPCAGTEGDNEPVMVDLNGDALARWVDFVNDHGQTMDGMSGSERAAYSKLEGYAARFALLFHCVRQATGENGNDYVDREDIERGIQLVRWFGNETLRVYGELSRDESDRANSELVKVVQKNGGTIGERELSRGPRRYRKPGAASDALEELVQAGLGEWFYPPQKDTGGEPVRSFRLFDFQPGDTGDGDGTPAGGVENDGCVTVAMSPGVRR